MKTKLLTLALFLGLANFSSAIENVPQAQAMYIYNFLRHIQLPENSVQSQYIIGVAGDSEVYNALIDYTKGKTIAGRPLKIVKCKDCSEMLKCNVLYIPNDKEDKLSYINKQLQDSNCLTIFENSNNMESGAIIDLVYSDEKLSYNINNELATNKNILISKILVNMARN